MLGWLMVAGGVTLFFAFAAGVGGVVVWMALKDDRRANQPPRPVVVVQQQQAPKTPPVAPVRPAIPPSDLSKSDEATPTPVKPAEQPHTPSATSPTQPSTSNPPTVAPTNTPPSVAGKKTPLPAVPAKPPAKKEDPFDLPAKRAERELDEMAKQLKSKDIAVRLKSIETIAAKGEAAAPVAGPLCDAILDSSPRVKAAALAAVEKVRPDLYKPLAALLVDGDPYNRIRGAKELGLLEEQALPTVNILLSILRRELAETKDFRYGLTEMQKQLFTSVRQIKPDDTATVSI
jgi:hypothetical protein